MKRRILVTAANTGCGKTFTTLSLLESLAKRGLRVGAIKPIETGVITEPEDGAKLFEACRRLNPDFGTVALDDVVPVQMELPAAPVVATKNPIKWEDVEKALEKIEAVSDIMLIESAGGIMTPIEDELFVIDMAKRFQAELLFLSTDKLGMISETLVNHAFIKAKGLSCYWAINRFGTMEDFDTINRPYLETRFKRLYMLPDELEGFTDLLLNGNPD